MTENRAPASINHAWFVVVVLTLGYVVSFIDRQILSLLIEPIRRDLGLSDFQMSWVGPPAFAVSFLVFGLVFGHYADRVNRIALLALGIATWCVMTAACAFADSAFELFIARMGVGCGEAALVPCALSLISDLFPRERVGRAVGVFSMGTGLGSSAAFIVGGSLVVWLAVEGHDPFANLGVVTPWRETFLFVGVPGLLLLPLLLMVREPPRRERLKSASTASVTDTLAFLKSHRQVYVPLILSKSVLFLIAGAQFWIVPMFERTWGWSPGRAGTLWGGALLIAGLIGVNIGGWLSDHFYRRGRKDGALRTVSLAMLVALPLHAVAPLMPSGELALALLVPSLIAIGAGSAAVSAAVILVTPNEFRGRITAFSLLIASGLGQFIGPTSVAALTDFLFDQPDALRYSIAIAIAAFSVVAALALAKGVANYRNAMEKLEGVATK
jgi:MFS family permease